jgi:hypothetical protein
VRFNLDLVKKEIRDEVELVGVQETQWLDNLANNRFDSVTYRSAIEFLTTLRRFYINRYNKTEAEREKKIISMTDTPEKEKEYISSFCFGNKKRSYSLLLRQKHLWKYIIL